MIKILRDISKQQNNWRIGEPWRPSEKALWLVVPIFHDVVKDRQYVLAKEAGEKFSVIDSGNIRQLVVENKGDRPVFVRVGEIVQSTETQSRMLVQSTVVFANEKKNVESRCVFASKKIVANYEFEKNGVVVTGSILTDVIRENRAVSQSVIWDKVSTFSASLCDNINYIYTLSNAGEGSGCVRVESSERSVVSDDLADNLQNVEKTIKELFDRMPTAPTQSGVAILGRSGCQYIEFFDSSESWQKSRDIILTSEIELFARLDLDALFECKVEKAGSVIKDVLELDYKETVLYQNGYKVIKIEADKYVGQITEMNEDVIHCVITRID